MKNLKDFASENKFENKTQTSNVDEKYIREKVSQYSNLSKKEMMSKLFSEVSSLKQSGNFNFEKISGMAENVKSYLTTEQQKSLENLLKQIRWEMNFFEKIDKSLLGSFALSEDIKQDCIVYVENFSYVSKKLENNFKILKAYPFINAFAISLKQNEMLSLAQQPWLRFITKQSSVLALMNVAKKVLNIDERLTGKGVTICYIDTGIKPHLDFTLEKNRIIKFVDFVGNRIKPYDDNGHGTFVAGVGSGSGIVSGNRFSGIAPKSNIISIKALNGNGEAGAVKILDAMQWVFDNHKKYNIKVVCMSFGSEPLGYNDPIMRGAEALWDLGIVVVAAAGNSGPDYETIKSPGVSSKIITVGGLNDNRLDDENFNRNFFEIASFSSRGPALRRYKPDLLAPAVNISSCACEDFYTSLSGTSVATPMIAGMCALIIEKNSHLSPDGIKNKIINSCNAITYNRNIEGSGLPDFSKIKF